MNHRPRTASTRQILSVRELTSLIKDLLEKNWPSLWVEGELSNVTQAHSGHVYFTLKDERSQISCVMFKGQAAALPFRPREGQSVVVHGRLGVYEPRGSYQIIVSSMEDKGEGRLRELFEQLKRKLEAEGLFDPSRKKALPAFPRTIALITSPRGAAVRDLIRVIHRRHPHTLLRIFPVRVQGEEAAGEIAAAVKKAGSDASHDLIIVGRGGGSIEDLWAFNEEIVARAVADCPLPTISAVGHETDFTICDFVADVRAATPSMAGEMAVPRLEDQREDLFALVARMQKAQQYALARLRLDLQTLKGTLKSPERRLADQRLALDGLHHHLTRHMQERLLDHRETLARHALALERKSPRTALDALRKRLHFSAQAIRFHAVRDVPTRRRELAGLAHSLDALSPLRVLERGYSLTTTPNGEIVTDASRILEGSPLDVRLAKGKLGVRVSEVHLEDKLPPARNRRGKGVKKKEKRG